MNIKNKSGGRRRQSNSREHHSNLRSSSKSQQKSKQRCDSKLLLRGKGKDECGESEEVCRSHKKITTLKQMDTSNEYYSYYRGKSKSKGKLTQAVEAFTKVNYFNNIYMHKETSKLQSTSHLQPNSHLQNNHSDHTEQQPRANQILNKIRMIEKNGSIDSNGKFVVRESKLKNLQMIKSVDGFKSVDSQQTISINEELKKDKNRKKQKGKKDIKTKGKKQDKEYREHKVGVMRSADKFLKKKQPKQLVSPSILVEKYYEAEISKDGAEMAENPFVRGRELPKNPILTSRTSKTILSEETQTSPPQALFETPRPTPILNIPSLIDEITEERNNCLNPSKLKMIYKGNMGIERVRCIELISKLCGNFKMRREAHSLSVYYMDKYLQILNKQMTPKQLKLIALTSLMLALKIDDGIMSRRLCHEFINHMDSILGNASKTHKSRSIQKHKEVIGSLSSRQNSGTLNKSKSQSNISQLGLSRGQDVKKSRQGDLAPTHHPKEMTVILSLQLDILTKFSFRLMVRSSTYWVDKLTLFWDSHLCSARIKDEQLTFRNPRYKKNISYCYQLLQKLSLCLDAYKYPKPYLVLSAIYLLIRMRMEQQQSGEQCETQLVNKYMTALTKSTNLIFYDTLGVNELFGDFLSELSMNISELIECVQFVGQQLSVFRVFTFTAKNKYIHCKLYEHQISLYESNPDIYRYGDEQAK